MTIAIDEPMEIAVSSRSRSVGEGMVFSLLYESVVRADCAGRISPGLAESWTVEDGGRTWVFRLRDAGFWDGRQVTADDVVRSWSDSGFSPDSLVEVTALSERVVRVRLAQDAEASVFVHPRFAVTRHDGNGRWPVGTGRFRPRFWRGRPSPSGSMRLESWDSRGGPEIEVQVVTARDARDLIDGGADLIISRDPSVVEYAGARSDLTVVALPWDRVYVLLSPSRVRSVSSGDVAGGWRTGLARDAVRGEARAAAGPHWWAASPACGPVTTMETGPAVRGGSTTPRILYDRADRDARDLVERLVSVAAAPPGPGGIPIQDLIPDTSRPTFRPVAFALATDALPGVLRRGRDAAYVIGLPRDAWSACAAVRTLVADVPWLAGRLRGGVVPLVETRRRAVVRHEGLGVTLGWGGAVTLAIPPTEETAR